MEGFVLSAIPYKETSRILNVLTKEYGVIGVIAKGCRSIKSKIKTISERFSYGYFHIYYKKNGLSTLVDGDVIDYFENIKSDIVKISYMTYMSELTLGVYNESENDSIYSLFISSIKKIEDGLDPQVISNILELQYLSFLGINLDLDKCVKCGSSKIVTISLLKGGYVCNKCMTNEYIYNEKVIKMLRLYNYVDISKISKLDIDKNVSNTINDILDKYYDEYSGIHPKSKSFLKSIV